MFSNNDEKDKLLHQIRSIGGRFGAIEGAIEQGRGCSYVLQAIAAARGSLDSLLLKVIEKHVRRNVNGHAQARDPATAELIELVRVYLK